MAISFLLAATAKKRVEVVPSHLPDWGHTCACTACCFPLCRHIVELIGCSWHAESAGDGTPRSTAPELFFVQAYCETCPPARSPARPPACLPR
jgi:hypothetical protein